MRNSLFVCILACCAYQTALAAPVTFSFKGSGSGTLDGMSFGQRNFVITASGDTNDRLIDRPLPINPPSGWTIEHSTAQIIIEGLTTATFITPTRTFVNTDPGTVGFSRSKSIGGYDLMTGWQNQIFQNWAFASSIGPISGQGVLRQWGRSSVYSPIQTTSGELIFNDNFSVPATFQAIIVPEPTAILLLALAPLGFLAIRRR